MAATNAASGQVSPPTNASALRSLLTRVEASIAYGATACGQSRLQHANLSLDFRLVESHLGAIQNMPLVATSSGGIHDERAATVADLVAKPLLPKDLASDDVLQACPALEPFVSGGLPGAQDMVATLAQRSDASIHGDSSSEQSPGDGSDGGSDNGSGSGGDTSDGGDDSDGSDVGSRTSRSRRSARKTSARTPSTGKRGARRSSRAAAGAKSSGAPKTTRLGARSRPQHQLITLWKSIHSNKYAPPFRKPVWLTVVLLAWLCHDSWLRDGSR